MTRPYLVIPRDHPSYDELVGLSLEQRAALPARFHFPGWLDAIPGAFVCAVCWDEDTTTAWPCATAQAHGREVFGEYRTAARSESTS